MYFNDILSMYLEIKREIMEKHSPVSLDWDITF